jgi:competence protein ComFC
VFLNFLFPRLCYLCQKPGSYFCPSCQKKIPLKKFQYCSVCDQKSIFGYTHTSCSHKNFPDLSLSIFDYTGPIRTALHDLKYRFVSDLARQLSSLLSFQIKTKYPDLLSFWQTKNFIFLPVPLYKIRQNYRGFNQSALLAQLLAQNLNLSFENILLRHRSTKPQYRLTKTDRRKNLASAFSLLPDQNVKNKNYLLFDDIYTTGTTLSVCTQVLRKNKAHLIHTLTVAR